jgi:recombination protein RecT
MATTALTEIETLTKFMVDNESRIKASMPAGVRAELITRSLTSAMRADPKIAACTPKSLINCLEQMIMTGLDVGKGMIAKAYLVPYGKEAQFQIGYKGVKELVRRSGQGRLVMHEVREGDHFKDLGEFAMPEFRPSDDPKRFQKKLTWVFAAYIPSDGTSPVVKVWSRERCLAHRKQYAKGYKGNKTDFWHEDHPGFPVMCMKCPVMELAGRGDLPLSADHMQMLDSLQAMREVEPLNVVPVPPNSITDQSPPEDEPIPVDWEYVEQELDEIVSEKVLDVWLKGMVDAHPQERTRLIDRCEEHRSKIRGE